MNDKIEQIKSRLLLEERFSPSSIVRDFNVELSVAQWICDELQSENPEITKWYRATCPRCEQFARGFSSSELTEVDEASCEDCGLTFPLDDRSLSIYFKNNPKKKDQGHKPKNRNQPDVEIKPTPVKILDGMHKPPQEWLLKSPRNLIWHISDLHFRGGSLSLGHGNCDTLRKRFLEIISTRGPHLANDVVVISGDCTDDGRRASEAAFEGFLAELASAGASKDRIVFVPGNHDSWNGWYRGALAFFSYFGLKIEKRLLRKFQTYPPRKLPKVFGSFTRDAIVERVLSINGNNFRFVAINTAVPFEMARGVFPIGCKNLGPADEIRVAVMHHHLIDELNKVTLDGDVLIKSKWMRVLNPAPALNYLFTNKFSISLHGHKHLQYHKREAQLNNSQTAINLLSAPSLFEKKYDQDNGVILGDNCLGFNLVHPKDGEFDLYFFRLEKWNYCLKHYNNSSY